MATAPPQGRPPTSLQLSLKRLPSAEGLMISAMLFFSFSYEKARRLSLSFQHRCDDRSPSPSILPAFFATTQRAIGVLAGIAHSLFGR